MRCAITIREGGPMCFLPPLSTRVQCKFAAVMELSASRERSDSKLGANYKAHAARPFGESNGQTRHIPRLVVRGYTAQN